MPDEGASRKAGPVVPADAAPNEPPIEMRWIRGKPAQIPKISQIPKRQSTGNHISYKKLIQRYRDKILT